MTFNDTTNSSNISSDAEYAEAQPIENESTSNGVLTFLHMPAGYSATKQMRVGADGLVAPVSKGAIRRPTYYQQAETIELRHQDHAFQTIYERSKRPDQTMILGAPIDGPEQREFYAEYGQVRASKNEKDSIKPRRKTAKRQDPAFFKEAPSRFFMFDFDPKVAELTWCKSQGLDVYADAAGAAKAIAEEFLPSWASSATLMWQLSSSAGKGGKHDVSVHFFVWLTNLAYPEDIKHCIMLHNDVLRERGYVHFTENQDPTTSKGRGPIDLALYQAVQPHFIAAPIFSNGSDPLPHRFGVLHGETRAAVLPASDKSPKTGRARSFSRSDGSKVSAREIKQASRLPSNCAGNISLIGDDKAGFHEPVRQATYWYAVEQHKAGLPIDYDGFPRQLRAAILNANPGTRSVDYIEKCADLRTLRDDLAGISATAKARVAQFAEERKQRLTLTEPYFPAEELPLDAAVSANTDAILAFFDAAAHHHRENELDAALEEEKRATGSRVIDFSHFTYPPEHIVAGEMSLGKTRAFIDAIIEKVDLLEKKIYVAVPTHHLAKELYDDFETAWTALGKADPAPAVIYRGQQRGLKNDLNDDADAACKTTGATRQLVEKIRKSDTLTMNEAACPNCPLKDDCEYHAQFADKSPGVKIITHAHLGAERIPGMGKDSAPTFGLVIDEGFNVMTELTSQLSVVTSATEIRQISTVLTDIAKQAAGGSITTQSLKDAGVLDYNGALVGPKSKRLSKKLQQKIGRIKKAPRNQTAVNGLEFYKNMTASRYELRLAGESMAREGQIGECSKADFMLLLDAATVADEQDLRNIGMVWYRWARAHLNDRRWDLTAQIGESVKAGEEIDAKFLKERQKLVGMLELVEVIANERPHSRDVLYGATIGKDGKTLRISYRPTITKHLQGLPVLHTNSTADEMLVTEQLMEKQPITHPETGEPVGSRIALGQRDREFTRIKVQHPYSTYIQVVNAPASMANLNKSDGKSLSKLSKRARRDSDAEKMLRVMRLFTEQAPSAGVITYKEHKEYGIGHGAFGKDVIPGHLNNVAGSNKWKTVPFLGIAGRPLVDDETFNREVRSFCALSPGGRSPKLDGGIQYEQLPVRVRLGDGSLAGQKIRASWHADEFARKLLWQLSAAPVEQALGRGRGARASAERPLVVLVCSDVVMDQSFDAIIDWSALAQIDEIDVLKHGAGFCPDTAGDMLKVVPGIFGKSESGRWMLRSQGSGKAVYPLLRTSSSSVGGTPQSRLAIQLEKEDGQQEAEMRTSPYRDDKAQPLTVTSQPIKLTSENVLFGEADMLQQLPGFAARQLSRHEIRIKDRTQPMMAWLATDRDWTKASLKSALGLKQPVRSISAPLPFTLAAPAPDQAVAPVESPASPVVFDVPTGKPINFSGDPSHLALKMSLDFTNDAPC